MENEDPPFLPIYPVYLTQYAPRPESMNIGGRGVRPHCPMGYTTAMPDFFTRNKGPVVIVALALLGATFLGGYALGERRVLGPTGNGAPLSADPGNPPPGVNTAPLWKAWAVLDEKFVSASTTATRVGDDERLWGAISGLAQSFGDPYTVFLPPEDNEAFASDINGSFEGVGMEVGMRDGNLVVVSPLPETPAARAGLRPGDRILSIDDVSTDGMTVERAVKLIRGPKDTTVTLTIAREGADKILTVSVVRAAIHVPAVTTEKQSDGIFVIKIASFSALAPSQFRAALREFVDANTDKMIIDLRNNPGGFLEGSVDMASWFLRMGAPVVREDSGGKKPEVVHRSKGYAAFNSNLKLVMLVNKGSASASEIFAGALSEYQVGKLIGEPTFGKGSVQELVEVTEDTSLKVTIARWLTPRGKSISDGGLAPDIEVEMTAEDLEAGRDPQMERAVEYLKTFPQILIINQTNPI